MKQSKAISIALTAANVVLIILCVVLYLRSDRTAPRFDFQAAEVVYREDMDPAELLEGITAYDEKDGDVTDRIVIEKIIGTEEDDSVVVFFAVSDKAGNAAKFSKVFKTPSGR